MFTYKGISAKDMHLRVLNNMSFSSPTRDINMIQVPGRDGDLVMDNGRFNSVIRSIPCRVEVPNGVDVEKAINNINNWLIDDGCLHEFEWDGDSEYGYLARVSDDVVSHRLLSRLGTTTIDFRLHPIKYLRSSLIARSVVDGESIMNRFAINAKPILRVEGEGNITIDIGGRPLILERIGNGGCIIDSEAQTITDLAGTITLFERMRSPFPILKPGNNTITITGNAQISIAPRFGVLV